MLTPSFWVSNPDAIGWAISALCGIVVVLGGALIKVLLYVGRRFVEELESLKIELREEMKALRSELGTVKTDFYELKGQHEALNCQREM